MPDQDILRMGKLYMEDLGILRTESSVAVLTYAVLTSLSETSFARNHNSEIILSTSKLADFMQGRLSSRMIRRQLNGLKTSMKGRFTENRQGRYSRIRLTRKNSRGRFIQVFSPSCKSGEYTASEIILFSLLLDRAAFNYRCGNEFCVLASQIPGVISASGLCRRTALNALALFALRKLITASDGSNLKTGTEFYKCGFTFSQSVFLSYQEQVNLKRSEKCLKLAAKRLHGLNAASAVCSKSGTSAAEAVTAKAAAPNPEAQKPRTEAQYGMSGARKTPGVIPVRKTKHDYPAGIMRHNTGDPEDYFIHFPDCGKSSFTGMFTARRRRFL